jgi:hypothetical protein
LLAISYFDYILQLQEKITKNKLYFWWLTPPKIRVLPPKIAYFWWHLPAANNNLFLDLRQ